MAGFYSCSKALLRGHVMRKHVLAPTIFCTQNACTFCLFAPKIVRQNWEETLCLESYCRGKNSPIYPHFISISLKNQLWKISLLYIANVPLKLDQDSLFLQDSALINIYN